VVTRDPPSGEICESVRLFYRRNYWTDINGIS